MTAHFLLEDKCIFAPHVECYCRHRLQVTLTERLYDSISTDYTRVVCTLRLVYTCSYWCHTSIETRGGRPRLIMHTLRDYVITATEQDGCDRFGSEVYEAQIF